MINLQIKGAIPIWQYAWIEVFLSTNVVAPVWRLVSTTYCSFLYSKVKDFPMFHHNPNISNSLKSPDIFHDRMFFICFYFSIVICLWIPCLLLQILISSIYFRALRVVNECVINLIRTCCKRIKAPLLKSQILTGNSRSGIRT